MNDFCGPDGYAFKIVGFHGKSCIGEKFDAFFNSFDGGKVLTYNKDAAVRILYKGRRVLNGTAERGIDNNVVRLTAGCSENAGQFLAVESALTPFLHTKLCLLSLPF